MRFPSSPEKFFSTLSFDENLKDSVVIFKFASLRLQTIIFELLSFL